MGALETSEAILKDFIQASSFQTKGAVITDLDGTAVHEFQGKIAIPKEVEYALLHHYRSGRPVVLNSLRFPLSVLRTFGSEWYKLSNAPIPTVTSHVRSVSSCSPPLPTVWPMIPTAWSRLSDFKSSTSLCYGFRRPQGSNTPLLGAASSTGRAAGS